jgi:CubicO group peptidase (beta-lactamase class C family)
MPLSIPIPLSLPRSFSLSDLLEVRVRPYPTASVTARNDAAEAPPAEAGMTPADVAAIWRATEALYETRLYPAVALCLRRRGKVVIDRAIGHASGNCPDEPRGAPLVPATPKTLFSIFSASKAVTAMVIHLLDERRLVHLDDAVAEYIPEFAKHGKERITIRHVLTHRAGIPTVPGHMIDLDLALDQERVVRLLCEAKPTWRPGRRLAYHALTGGFVLGEIVRRVTGRSIRDVLQDEVLAPLGIADLGYGVPAERIPEVARHTFTGPSILFPFDRLLRRALGVDFKDAIRFSNDPRFLTGIVPAGNVIGTASSVGRFFEMLLRGGELDGVRVFDRRTIHRAVQEQSYLEMDLTMVFPVRYGMGFVLGADLVSIYGPGTPNAFGHLGFTNILAWADPDRDISGCIMTSGKPFASPGVYRLYDLMRHIARHCSKIR